MGMQLAQEITQNLGPGLQSSLRAVPGLSSDSKRGQPERVIDRLFVRMNSNYGHLWASRFQSDAMLAAAKQEWALGLAEFTVEQIGRGIERCFEEYSLTPTMTQFRECCRPDPAEFGLPDVESAYREACRLARALSPAAARWSHPVVYYAGRQVGWFDLERSEGGVEKRFGKIYQGLCQRVVAGEQFELPRCDSRSLGHDASGVKTRTEQEKQASMGNCRELLDMLGGRKKWESVRVWKTGQ